MTTTTPQHKKVTVSGKSIYLLELFRECIRNNAKESGAVWREDFTCALKNLSNLVKEAYGTDTVLRLIQDAENLGIIRRTECGRWEIRE